MRSRNGIEKMEFRFFRASFAILPIALTINEDTFSRFNPGDGIEIIRRWKIDIEHALIRQMNSHDAIMHVPHSDGRCFSNDNPFAALRSDRRSKFSGRYQLWLIVFS